MAQRFQAPEQHPLQNHLGQAPTQVKLADRVSRVHIYCQVLNVYYSIAAAVYSRARPPPLPLLLCATSSFFFSPHPVLLPLASAPRAIPASCVCRPPPLSSSAYLHHSINHSRIRVCVCVWPTLCARAQLFPTETGNTTKKNASMAQQQPVYYYCRLRCR